MSDDRRTFSTSHRGTATNTAMQRSPMPTSRTSFDREHAGETHLHDHDQPVYRCHEFLSKLSGT
jgi:hypothetical protein